MVDDEPPRISGDFQTKNLLLQHGRGVFVVLIGLSIIVAVAAVAGAACASLQWQSAFAPALAEAFEVPSGPGFAHRRPSCEPSGDPEYPCLLSRPPNAFDGEIAVFFSGEREHLSVKIVVPGVARPGSGGKGWAALGFSPDGRMAGPSEADVGFIGEDGDLQGDGISSVTVLCKLCMYHRVLWSKFWLHASALLNYLDKFPGSSTLYSMAFVRPGHCKTSVCYHFATHTGRGKLGVLSVFPL